MIWFVFILSAYTLYSHISFSNKMKAVAKILDERDSEYLRLIKGKSHGKDWSEMDQKDWIEDRVAKLIVDIEDGIGKDVQRMEHRFNRITWKIQRKQYLLEQKLGITIEDEETEEENS